jgi:hypothetical protein
MTADHCATNRRECITPLVGTWHNTECFDREMWTWWCTYGDWDGRSSRWSLIKPLHAVETIERQRRAREAREGRPCAWCDARCEGDR